MNMFDVYPLFDIEPTHGIGSYVWDTNGNKYLDLYGGHAVISIGHSHPHYVERVSDQLKKLGFYSNFIQNPLQEELAEKLGKASNCEGYSLFLCNSGAEAVENALKLASFHNGKKRVVTFSKAFHGRTSLAVSATDNPSITAPINKTDNFIFVPYNDEESLELVFKKEEICAVIIEGIQGVGGVNVATESFLKKIRDLCNNHDAVFIADGVQCGYGRSGRFFSHDYSGVKADIYTLAKGMGNGFPVGGIMIAPHIKPKSGMLGTTFGGNHLACCAALAVLEVFEKEHVIKNSFDIGSFIMEKLKLIKGIKEVRGKGLMIGIELHGPCDQIRKKLLFDHHIFTGSSSNKNTLRLLPSLTITKEEIGIFPDVLKKLLMA